MAQNAKNVKEALDAKEKKEKTEQPASSAIHYFNLAYIPEKDPHKPPGNKVLGKGGCGVVYLGTYRQVQGHVALKSSLLKAPLMKYSPSLKTKHKSWKNSARII